MPLYNPATSTVTDATLSTSDITTNDSSTSKHGFLKKLDNNAAHFMAGDGSWATPAGTGTFSADANMPWHVSIIPMVWTPDATVGTWTFAAFTDNLTFPFLNPAGTTVGATALFNTSSAQNDAIAWDLTLAAGTWDCHFHVRKSTNTGIITLNQDGASQGTVDTYAAAAAYAKVSITGWTVSATGKKRMQILMATKNASSSNYIAELYAIDFRRTA
jgi:hypothetical protein